MQRRWGRHATGRSLSARPRRVRSAHVRSRCRTRRARAARVCTRVHRERTGAPGCRGIGDSAVARHHGGAPCAVDAAKPSGKRRRTCARVRWADAFGARVDLAQRRGLGKAYCDYVMHGRPNPGPTQPAAWITADRNGVRDESPRRSCRFLRNAGYAAALRGRCGPANCRHVASSAHLSLIGRGALQTGSRAASFRTTPRPRPARGEVARTINRWNDRGTQNDNHPSNPG
jgi:hypothetical protein